MDSYYELYHHGIKGQKWGVRRYQDKNGKLTSTGKARLMDKGSSNEAINYSKHHKSSKGAPVDMVSDAEAVNGGARGAIAGFNRDWNCAFCSTAYELRRRGQDVQAQESLSGVSRDASKLAFIGLKKSDIKPEATRNSGKTMHIGMTQDEFNAMEQSILKDGNNTRGRMGVQWKAVGEGFGPNGGHAFNYEVKNGKFYIVDPQVGQVLSGKDAQKYMSNAINVEHYRTDNLKVNNRVASKYFVEKKSDIRINKEAEKAYKNARAAENLATVAFASHVVGVGGGMVEAWPVAAAGAVGFTIGATASAAVGVNAQRHANKAEKAQQNESLALEKEWEKENRMKFYSSGKQKGGRKK